MQSRAKGPRRWLALVNSQPQQPTHLCAEDHPHDGHDDLLPRCVPPTDNSILSAGFNKIIENVYIKCSPVSADDMSGIFEAAQALGSNSLLVLTGDLEAVQRLYLRDCLQEVIVSSADNRACSTGGGGTTTRGEELMTMAAVNSMLGRGHNEQDPSAYDTVVGERSRAILMRFNKV